MSYSNDHSSYHDIMMCVASCFCPVELIKQGNPTHGLGESMNEARKFGYEMPEAVDVYEDDEPKVAEMKHLILHMTSFEAKDRPSATEVFHQTHALYIRKDPKTATVKFDFSFQLIAN